MRFTKPLIYVLVGVLVGWGIARLPHPESRGQTQPGRKADLHAQPEDFHKRAALSHDEILSEFSTRLKRGFVRKDRHWDQLIGSLNSDQISLLVGLTMKVDDGQVRSNFIFPLFHQWGRIAPQEALRAVDKLSKFRSDQDSLLTDRVLSGWAYVDVQEMAEWSLNLRHGDLRKRAIRALIEFSDDLSLPTIIQLAHESSRNGPNSNFFWLWAERDPINAARAVEKLPASNDRSQLTRSVTSAWARQNPAAALDWFIDSGEINRANGISDLISQIAQRDPLYVAQSINRFSVGAVRTTVIHSLINSWVQSDSQAAFTWLIQRPIQQSSSGLFSGIAYQMGSESLDPALKLAKQLPEGGLRQQFVSKAYEGFTETNPDAALPLIKEMESSTTKDQLVKSVLSNIGNSDPRRSLGILDEFPDLENTTFLIENLIKQIAEQDLAEALDLVPTLRSEQDRNHVLLALVRENVNRDPAVGALIATALTPGPATTEAYKSIAQSYARLAPDAALDWVAQLPTGSDRDLATLEILGPLSANDQSAAANLALSLNPGEIREKGVSMIARGWSFTNSNEALNWAVSLSGSDRTAALGGLATNWLINAPEKAFDYFSRLPASDLDSNFLNEAAKSFVNNPKIGIQLVDGLPPSHLRTSALDSLVSGWIELSPYMLRFPRREHPLRVWQLNEPGGPDAWIDQTELAEETKVDLKLIVAGGTPQR